MNKDLEVFEKYESEVRSYCRTFPKEFVKSKNEIIEDIEENKYIDFFCGAGALNYGHNNDYIKEKLIEYLKSDGIMHSLDMYTTPKKEFISFFEDEIIIKRGFNYKIQFTGPTGANAVEAALKLARKVKKRTNIFALMGCFHGMSLGALALTSDAGSRGGAGIPLTNVTHIPVPYMFDNFNVIDYLDKILSDDHSGIDKPAAIIIETVQAEGGIYVFENSFLQGIRKICDKYDILLIVDDIQVGCARTGTFFSFERANIIPDIVIMSKSIGGYGMPMAITLIKPELDIWKPAEHNGTFRGNQLSLVAAKAGLEFMLKENIESQVREKEKIIYNYLKDNISEKFQLKFRGIGLLWGIETEGGNISKEIVKECFARGLILERAGRDDCVVKIMPPLTIRNEKLLEGLEIIKLSIQTVLSKTYV